LRRIACGVGVNLILLFQLERGDDRIKHYRKMKRRQRARLGSMRRKRDMSWWCEAALGRRKRVDDVSWADTNLTELKMKKIHTDNSVGTTGR
jgi:hypothetical protein